MDRGIYAALSGGLSNDRLLEVIGNNLANANTVGYKAERLSNRQQDFSDTLAGVMGSADLSARNSQIQIPGVAAISTVTDFTAGPIEYTGNPLHVALVKENQFFVVQGEKGESYTRAGNFSMDQNGFLVTPSGSQVMGEGGPITLKPGSQITANGTIMAGTEEVGRLRVVEIDDLKKLQRQTGTSFTLSGGAQAAAVEANVIPESVELPNISIVQSMVEMVNAGRAFESYTKSARTIGELDETAMRTVRSAG